MNFFERRKILRMTRPGDLIPVRVHGHLIEDEKVVLLIPKFTNRLIHNLYPKTRELFFRVKLDEPGSFTWECIDGKKTIYQIASEVKTRISETGKPFEDAAERAERFMSVLYDRECITFRQFLEVD
jgi:hypothetical protein